MEGDKDVHRGHVFARAQGVPGGGDEHQGSIPGVRAAPRHRAQDALAPRASGIPQEAPTAASEARALHGRHRPHTRRRRESLRLRGSATPFNRMS